MIIVLVVIGIWFIASCYFIYKDNDRRYYKDKTLTINMVIGTIVCSLIAGPFIFDPAQQSMGYIDTNPTFAASVGAGIIGATCITGPIAAIHYIKDIIEDKKEEKER